MLKNYATLITYTVASQQIIYNAESDWFLQQSVKTMNLFIAR